MRLEEITPELVASRWRVRGREREALGDYAARLGVRVGQGKLLVAMTGLALAWADHDETNSGDPDPVWLLSRARYRARHVLDDYGPMRQEWGEIPDDARSADETDALALAQDDPLAPEQERPSDLYVRHLELLRACVTSPQQQALLEALDHGCATLAEVDRLYGWSHGHAAVTASRVRRKLPALL